jgi:hypothetical protein
MNLLAAAWKLGNYQVWNRKRRWSTLGLLLFPAILVGGVALFDIVGKRMGDHSRPEFYQGFVTVALRTILLPIVAIFWGSAVLADEIEGKTLVYLWTRPRHRGLLLLNKLLATWVWLAALAFCAVLFAYVYAYNEESSGGLASNLPVLLWDWRALALGAIAYSAIGFLLSFLFRKPLTYGLLIAYAWEVVPQVGPGFLRRLSVRQHVLTLVTHKQEETAGLAHKLIKPVVITEAQALLTLAGIIVVCLAAGVWLATQREFLSDDPARNQ